MARRPSGRITASREPAARRCIPIFTRLTPSSCSGRDSDGRSIPSIFFENDRTTPTGLAGYLRERGLARVFLVGLAFDFCVLWSAEDARRLGFEAVVLRDACRSLDLDGSEKDALDRLQAAGGPLAVSAELG